MSTTWRGICVLAVLASAPAGAQDVSEGAALFGAYCATCHGPEATGNGPLAELISIETPDLTGLAVRNGGNFPVATVAAQIDGRDPLLAHGGDMPLFGTFFEGDASVALRAETGQPIMTSPPIADLIAWLQSVQN